MAHPRCFVCMSTVDTKARQLYYCCNCRAVHERCFIDYISTPSARTFTTADPDGKHRNWACTTCHERFGARLGGTSFWFSLCARHIRTWRKLRTVNAIFAIECVLTLCIQILLCAYVAKMVLWVFTHASSFTVTEYLVFTVRPNFSDILLGILGYLILVPPSMLVVYLVHITTHAPKKSERDLELVDVSMPAVNKVKAPFNNR